MRYVRILAVVLAVVALGLLLASGPVTRAGLWSWQLGLKVFAWAAYAGFAAAGVGLVLTVLAAVPRWRARAWIPVGVLCAGLVAAAPAVMMLDKAKSVPPIHDVTTDPFDPPAFLALMPMRVTLPNGAAYGGIRIAEQQQKGYPDIKPLVLKSTPAQTVQRAIDAARASGWEIVSADAPAGRIEATATTFWFGFKDDIIVRVRPEPSGGSRVDVRSVSRVGVSDVGANAARIREFLARLA